MSRQADPFPNAIGWRASGVLRGGIAHYFLGYSNSTRGATMTICSAATFHLSDKLSPERMARWRCKTCERSATRRGMR